MREFQYFKFNNNIDSDYVLLTSTEDAYFLYDDMYAQLSAEKGECFSIILDLILRNGYAFNRFVLLDFYRNKVVSKIINPREVSEEVKNNTKQFLQKNRDLLLDSALSSSVMNFILNS